MFKYSFKNVRTDLKYLHSIAKKPINVPKSADVVIIGGGSAGCHTLYHLAKRGVKAVLLERCKLTAGTTWHTAGLLWRIRPNDVDIQLLNRSRDMLIDIRKNTEYDPGWIENGGLFIARNKNRLNEYKRLSSIACALGIENTILTPNETKQIFPLLNNDSFIGALYSPGDGVIDPAMLCNALSKLAIQSGNGTIIENCPVNKILTEKSINSDAQSVIGVQTPHGQIKTKCIVNATGVWGRDLIEPLGISLPLIPMRHSYIISEPIDGIKGMPNVRDHDASIYFRIQGSSICMGGYENIPILVDRVASDFNFSLYDLDWNTFEEHVKGTEELCPAFAKAGISKTICGPESFTPDHKPLMGPDSRCYGLFHNCGFNSAGMMFGGGCGEQIAEWIIHDRPEFHMFQFDVERFTPEQLDNREWASERSHESYVKNYSMVFKHDQPLAGRNFKLDALYDDMIHNGAVMDEMQGYERPAFFYKERSPIIVRPYDWYGAYGAELNEDRNYNKILDGDCKYEFSEHHNLIGNEAITCRTNAVVFNLSYFCKLFISGVDAKQAMEWICTADVNKPENSIIYTCGLNDRGGVESDFTVTTLESGNGKLISPKFDEIGYYVVAGGATAYHTLTNIKNAIAKKQFNVNVEDVTDKIGIISVQGRESRNILQHLIDFDLTDDNLPPYKSALVKLKNGNGKNICFVRILRISFVGELGYELHVANEDCRHVYSNVMAIGSEYGLKNAGYRAFYSLSCEKGYHLWGSDLRTDDTPIESGLGFTCRKNGKYKGHQAIEMQRATGIRKRLVYLTIDEKIPLWGLEGVYRNGKAVGFLRRAEYGYTIDKPIGKCYINRTDDQIIDNTFLLQGKYEIDVMGRLYEAKLHLKSPFDSKNQRIFGNYE